MVYCLACISFEKGGMTKVVLELDESKVIQAVYAENLLYLPTQSWLQRPLTEVFCSDFIQKYEEALKKALETKKHQEWRYICTNEGNTYGLCLFPRSHAPGQEFRVLLAVEKVEGLVEVVQRMESSPTNVYELSTDLIGIVDTKGRIKRVNQAWEKILGYMQKELIGKTIFCFIHPEDHMISRRAFLRLMHQEGREDSYINRWSDASGEYHYIEWRVLLHGDSVVGIGREVTKEILLRKRLDRQIDFQKMMMTMANSFINIPLAQMTNAIDAALRMLGEFVGMDRVYVFDYDPRQHLYNNNHEWCAPGISPQIHNLQKVPVQDVEQWYKSHLKGQYMIFEDIDALEEGHEVKAILQMQGVRSILTIPLFLGKTYLGFVGYDTVKRTHHFSAEEIQLLELFGHMLVNVQQRWLQEVDLAQKAEDNTLLLKEIHHRVKNNLQVVSSLLNLQGDYLKDPEARRILKNSENRVKAMALLHEKIYRTTSFSQVSMPSYIEEIGQYVFELYKGDVRKITFQCDVDEITLNVDQAMTCGLIINELITNALQHGFSRIQKGKVTVFFKDLGENILELTVKDNGQGLPEDFEKIKSKSLGVQLVESLVRQLKGRLNIYSLEETIFRIVFEKAVEERGTSASNLSRGR